MTDLIEEIFYREEDYRGAPGYQEAQRALVVYHKKIEKALGFDFMDKLATAEVGVTHAENLAAFRHGFHLAGQLLLELFSSRP